MFKRCYFFVFEVKQISKDKTISPEVLKYIKKYLKYRFKKINYFEPFTSDKTYVVVGSEEVNKKTNRNVLIFLLELYASLKDSNLKVTKDFKSKVIKVNDDETITIYKFKKFK